MKILVSAGPTVEDIDAVRFISNRSTGRMGFAVARAGVSAGHTVRLVSGPVSAAAPDGVEFYGVRSALDMLRALQSHFDWCDALIMTAAVGDYMPVDVYNGKRHKSGDPLEEWTIRLKPTPDILAALALRKRDDQTVIGFSVDAKMNAGLAQEKMNRKGLDFIVVNDVSSFGADSARFLILSSTGGCDDVGAADKPELASRLIELVEKQGRSRG
jgi:phosphopantothenoylcysteine decarboxylase/phosphopantothenate--cysteine ligase